MFCLGRLVGAAALLYIDAIILVAKICYVPPDQARPHLHGQGLDLRRLQLLADRAPEVHHQGIRHLIQG